jgi:hypothetical protein
VQDDWHLNELLCCHATDFLFEVVHGTRDDGMCHPVDTLWSLSRAQLMKCTKQLSYCEVLMIVQVQQNLVPCHVFEIDKVVNRGRLVGEQSSALGRVDFDSCLAWRLLAMNRQHELDVLWIGKDQPLSVCCQSLHLITGREGEGLHWSEHEQAYRLSNQS